MTILHQRIRDRREAFGASFADVASWSGLSESRWSEIETGGPVEVAELGRVADALAIDLGSLIQGAPDNPKRSMARFRSAPSAGVLTASDLRWLALAAEAGRIGGRLCALLDRPILLSDFRSIRPIDSANEPWRQGYRLGAQARSRLSRGPVENLEALLRKAGVHVVRVAFSDRAFEAASLWEPGAMPVILLNERAKRVQSVLPRRSTLAHELCHLLHDAGEHDLTTQLSWRSADAETTAIEQRARGFAPAFLAPPDEVKHWFQAGEGGRLHDPESKVLAIARRWGLSIEGAAWHAKNCRIIVHRTAERIVQADSPEPDWQDRFEDSGDPARTGRHAASSPFATGALLDVVESAARAGVISEGRAREVFALGS